MKPKRHAFLALLTLASFLIPQIVWPLPAETLTMTKSPVESRPEMMIQIPHQLASVEEVFEPSGGSQNSLLLHIQTLHGSAQAQKQIQKLLKFLKERYQINLLFVEGASEKLDPRRLDLFPDAKQNERLNEYLLRQGDLTGVERFVAQTEGGIEAVGLEMPDLYRSHLEVGKRILKYQRSKREQIRSYEERMDYLASQTFTPDLRRILSNWKKFRQDPFLYLREARQLTREAKKILGIDLDSLFAQVEWPQLTRLLALQALKPDLDPYTAMREKAMLIEFLKLKKAPQDLIKSLDDFGRDGSVLASVNASPGIPQSRMPRSILEQLSAQGEPFGFKFYQYPAFSLYAGYLVLESEIHYGLLLKEIEMLFLNIFSELAGTEYEKNLLELFQDLDLLKRLCLLRLTRRDWSQAVYRRQWLEFSAIQQRLTSLEGESRKGMMPALKDKNVPGNKSEKISDQDFLSLAFLYYDLALQREQGFFQVIRQELQAKKNQVAVVITGGFHGKGLMDLFRESKVQYGLLLPRIADSEYLKGEASMPRTPRTMFDMATIESVHLLQSSKAQRSMGADLLQFLRRILDAYTKISRYQDLEDAKGQMDYFNESRFAKDHQIRLELSPENQKAVWIKLGMTYMNQGKGRERRILQIPILPFDNTADGKAGFKLADHVEAGPLLSGYVEDYPELAKTELAQQVRQMENRTAPERMPNAVLLKQIRKMINEAAQQKIAKTLVAEQRDAVLRLPKELYEGRPRKSFSGLRLLDGAAQVGPSIRVSVEVLGAILKQNEDYETSLRHVQALEAVVRRISEKEVSGATDVMSDQSAGGAGNSDPGLMIVLKRMLPNETELRNMADILVHNPRQKIIVLVVSSHIPKVTAQEFFEKIRVQTLEEKNIQLGGKEPRLAVEIVERIQKIPLVITRHLNLQKLAPHQSLLVLDPISAKVFDAAWKEMQGDVLPVIQLSEDPQALEQAAGESRKRQKNNKASTELSKLLDQDPQNMY